MGAYINPTGMSKEQWLSQYGVRSGLGLATKWSDVPAGMLPVVLVNNGAFTAAGICYSPSELAAFTDPGDHRPRIVFFAKIEELHTVSEELKYYLR